MSSPAIFGETCPYEEARIIIIPVPWDVTASYSRGTSQGPQHICDASSQLDFFDMVYGTPLEHGIHMLPIPQQWVQKNNLLAPKAQLLQNKFDYDIPYDHHDLLLLNQINQACTELHAWVSQETSNALNANKFPVLIGGDHSTPLGLIHTLSEHIRFGILHIDAHADLREAYQGFLYSHASIMHNVLNLVHPPQNLVQVGIRDFCIEEFHEIQHNPNIHPFFAPDIHNRLFSGETWANICAEICDVLPDNIYISFDIDGLSPLYCPGTGTPVPGGLSYDQIRFLFNQLAIRKKNVVGFDINEVAPSPHGQWDGNVGARLLYQMIGLLLHNK